LSKERNNVYKLVEKKILELLIILAGSVTCQARLGLSREPGTSDNSEATTRKWQVGNFRVVAWREPGTSDNSEATTRKRQLGSDNLEATTQKKCVTPIGFRKKYSQAGHFAIACNTFSTVVVKIVIPYHNQWQHSEILHFYLISNFKFWMTTVNWGKL
jgi:hypothetical protein